MQELVFQSFFFYITVMSGKKNNFLSMLATDKINELYEEIFKKIFPRVENNLKKLIIINKKRSNM